MPAAFDPYHTWLGIPAAEQPPDHYRLLGIPRFEASTAAVEHASDRQMAHLRTLVRSEHAALAQRLLNEVAAARVCLLSAEKKAAYDQHLRERLASQGAGPPPAPPRHRAPPVRHQHGQATAVLEQLGEYKLLEKLGQGGMGTVYKAVHVEMDRVVAVKVLPPNLLQDERAVARFKREIRAVAQLKHPNVVEAFDAREIEGTRFLVMEYVEGTDVADLAKRTGPLPVADACEIIRQAALGLQCAHEHGLVHRDIKPGNLMLTPEGRVKLLDLGLARPQADQGEDAVTGTGEAMGTVDYMAPEQIVDSRTVDIRADVYSLGCTLYRLLAGRAPFSGPEYDTAGKKLVGQLQHRPEPIAAVRQEVPPALALVVERMMAKSPDERFGTPGEVAAVLQPFAADARLRALAAGKPQGAPAGEAMKATAASQSSGLTGFLRTIQGKKAPAPPAVGRDQRSAGPPHAPGAQGKRINPVLLYAAMAALVLLLVVALGVVLSSRRGEEVAKKPPGDDKPAAAQATLVLDWPARERRGAKITLNGRDETVVVGGARGDRVKLTLRPGKCAVRIERPGYEPFTDEVTLAEGKTATVAPVWRAAPEKPEPSDFPTVPGPGPEKPEPPKPPEEKKPEEEPGPKPVEKPPTEEKPQPKPQPKVDPAVQAREEKWRTGMQPVEELAAAWDFAGAQAALGKVRFDEPELQQRLACRADELKRMAGLKSKMIARIGAASPRLRKSDLMLRGMAGEVTGADERAIHATLASGKTEDHLWAELNEKARPKLLELAVDEKSADDWLAAGLMAFSAGDVPLAEKLLDKARSLGTDIGPYLGPLAAVTLVQVKGLIDEQKWTDAQKRLDELREKYGATPWFGENSAIVDEAAAAVKAGLREAEAEKLYAEAAELFKKQDLFGVRPLVEKLKGEYPNTALVTGAARKPSFAELEKAVADLGKMLTVRLDGKGDFKSIQAAIDAAPPNSLIEIQDNGPYNEKLSVPDKKEGLTIRGKRGAWPVITSAGRMTNFPVLLEVRSPNTTLSGLVLAHVSPAGSHPCTLNLLAPGRVHRCVVFTTSEGGHALGVGADARMEICAVFGSASVQGGRLDCTNTFWPVEHPLYFWKGGTFENVFLMRVPDARGPCTFRSCTIVEHARFLGEGNALLDCIVGSVEAAKPGTRIENCDVYRSPPFADQAKPGKGCFSAPPMFADPKNFDHRLLPMSPCRGKATDGGDLGVRYTPEMIEMLKLAFELRAKGIIKF